MKFPLKLNLKLSRYIASMKCKGVKKYPLVLMLEVTHRCNLRCTGCGRIREYKESMDKQLTAEECLASARECGAPVVSVTGGEPLVHPEIERIVQLLLDDGFVIYFCTNGLLLKDSLEKLRPDKVFSFSIHLDGMKETHDMVANRDGAFDAAIEGIQAAKSKKFRVCTNTTIYKETDLNEIEQLFELLTRIGVDGLLVAPGFSFQEVEEDHFLTREETMEKFRTIRTWTRRFPLHTTPVYMDFLTGKRKLDCTPWGNPTRNPVGWRSPCYLICDQHFASYNEMMEETDWSKYGPGKDRRCAHCMVHSGFEATAVQNMSLADSLRMAWWNLT